MASILIRTSSKPSADQEARDQSVLDRIRESTLRFAQCAGSASAFDAALDATCGDLLALFGATQATLWLHERREHALVVRGAAGDRRGSTGERVATDDPLAPAATALRLHLPIEIDGTPGLLMAPLRGLRRALGTLVVEAPTRPAGGARIELAAEVARLLSAGIETLQLLDEVLRQQRLLEDTFNSLVDCVAVTDNALRVIQTNDALAARLSRPRGEMFERPLADVVGSAIAEWTAHDDGVETRLARTRTFEGSPLGATVVVTVTPLRNGDGDLVGRVIVGRDVTAQVRLEAEREVLRGRLAQSEKLASLGQFVAGIAHEMNNPLQGVLGHLELLLGDPQTTAIRGELRRVFNEANRAAKIVHNLLDFTGARRMTRRRLKIERVLARAITSRRSALTRHAITVVREPSNTAAISGDPLLLQQVFVNILINAEHAIADTGEPGSISVTVEPSADGSAVITRVRDTGPGIPADVLPRIFDPFFTTKEVGRGMGLGLAITYGILKEHGGAIHAANAADGGAIVTVELPLADSAPPPHSPAPSDAN